MWSPVGPHVQWSLSNVVTYVAKCISRIMLVSVTLLERWLFINYCGEEKFHRRKFRTLIPRKISKVCALFSELMLYIIQPD